MDYFNSNEDGYMIAPATNSITSIEDFTFDDLLDCAYEELYEDDDSIEQDKRLVLLSNYEDLCEGIQNHFIEQFKNNENITCLLDILEYMEQNIERLIDEYKELEKIYQVNTFPAYMINYCENDDKNNITEDDIKNYEDWLKDNNYEYCSCDTDTEERFCSYPQFGLPCNVTTAYFTKR